MLRRLVAAVTGGALKSAADILPQGPASAATAAAAAVGGPSTNAPHSAQPTTSAADMQQLAPDAGSETFAADMSAAMHRSLDKTPGLRKVLAGTDLDGNEYYELYEQGRTQTRRLVDMKIKAFQFESDTVPVQWESWLRRRRIAAPTHDELLADRARRETLARRVMDLQLKEVLHPRLVAWLLEASLSHAAAPLFRAKESESPSRSGDNFQVGTWQHKSNAQNAKGAPASSETQPEGSSGSEFEPEAWQPGQERR
ncbi:hypothetical protein CAOG_06120 [Capsaspora owczarzaki ATCC 30864]|uniref:hypothetical protein n=1 Tax=Capsaspora owczarzaki (strain ATCC 30864) TaxID=595528 RepID=UPI0001FE2746|nr:hypothetical protein CAOG_06120 [Capsaspora owczarzaki ATCC 30864]|eukprot:XP_004345710.1 hypothetical protein CAOG_06120 [Capsaspora owczarzaki ATCC 30864]